MGYAIGTVTKGAGDNCHYQLLGVIKTLAEANGWVTQRYDTASANRELILKSQGLSGTEEIYVGFQTYQNVGADYYNILAATFTGYVAANTFTGQPGYIGSGVPAHNNAITYFISCNAQRIVACLKVGTPVYEHFYVGKMFPYARPGEYPSPLVNAGMFNGAETKRFSDTAQQFPYPGYYYSTTSYLKLRGLDGSWNSVWCYPFTNKSSDVNALAGPATSNSLVPADTYYQLEPIILSQLSTTTTPSNVWGELDGVYFCSGFNNSVENVVQMGGTSTIDQTGMTVLQAVDAILAVGGRAFVMCQNVNRTSWRDYVALEMK